MKRIVSVSLGSPAGDHCGRVTIEGETIEIVRRGTNGDLSLARQWLSDLDGKVDAIGLGGINLYLGLGRPVRFRQGWWLARAAQRTPVVDGFWVKAVTGRLLPEKIEQGLLVQLRGKVALVSSVLDRYTLAVSLAEKGCRLLIGDASFALGLPVTFTCLPLFKTVAAVTLPGFSRFPINWLYPIGEKQAQGKNRFASLYAQSEVLAGDFHFLRRYLPPDLSGRIVIASTLTAQDKCLLKKRGVEWVVSIMPPVEGRIFGCNAFEAALVARYGLPVAGKEEAFFGQALARMKWAPVLEQLG